MADDSVSPTGTPVLPTKFIPVAAGLLTLLGALGQALPQHTIAAKVLTGFSLLAGNLLGALSAGWRK